MNTPTPSALAFAAALVAPALLCPTLGCQSRSEPPAHGTAAQGASAQSAAEGPASAQPRVQAATQRTERPTYQVPRASEAPTIDGTLDEAAWGSATEPFVHPGNGEAVPGSPVRAQAWLAYDDTHLYLAMRVADAEAESSNGRDDVDPHVWASASGIELMLQPGDPGDNTHYYEVQVDVNGAVWDTRFDDYNAPITGAGAARRFGHQDWDAQLERAVAREPGHYVVEAALPWSAIAEHTPSERAAVPPASGDAWRANLYSFRDGQRASLAWSPLLGEGNFHRSARFGTLRFE